jgi:hypothetical protein
MQHLENAHLEDREEMEDIEEGYEDGTTHDHVQWRFCCRGV